ncbi:NAD(P)-binding protein [Lentithecium fluviatile CBS 122367]|uniref:NAD(P)-binding protein n=1 Tax=Lentithecium fluviatile CBS 122367 TaxID=1168545 RepID=A0A6G1IRN2_9PLEO|nr:NAD(P)-binding protein [Lentithecium fluviatile CBS 122367]
MSNNRVKKVAVVGASGRLASRIVPELLKTGQHTITAISRHDSTATFPDGVQVARVDYEKEESLVEALKGHDFLIITLGARVPPTLHASICNAGAKAGIPYIMPNVYGYDILNDGLNDDFVYGPVTKQGVKDVETSGANYIVLCCGFWYEWSLLAGENFLGFDIDNKKAVFFDDGKARINSSTLTQCGRAIAALLSLPITKEDPSKPAIEDWKNKGLYISSLLVSQRDILDSLNRVLGTSDSDWTITHENSKERTESALEEIKKGNFFAFAKALYTRVFYPNGDGDYESTRGVANELLGIEKEDLDECTKLVLVSLP